MAQSPNNPCQSSRQQQLIGFSEETRIGRYQETAVIVSGGKPVGWLEEGVCISVEKGLHFTAEGNWRLE
jgi:hypothetical protein